MVPRQLVKNQLYQYYKLQADPNIKFLIAPHAGLTYCVETQGAVFSKVDINQYQMVIILGVCHSFRCNGLKQSPFTTWEDPLGGTPLPIYKSKFDQVNPRDDVQEHSIELLVPFISLVLGNNRKIPLLPLYCGIDPSTKDIDYLKQLQQENKALIVISSDFSHFGGRFDYAPKMGNMTALQVVDYVNQEAVKGIKISAEAFKNSLEETQNTVCGRYTIYTGLNIFDNYEAELLSYTKSSVPKDFKDSCVCYCGIIGK
ncbi:Cell_motility MEMO family protein [Hexamita inflata]|uniref:Cell motility MEMO family protein n=1 Tax=Hexamita inflata TaxID=28002 RepID=A0AA86U1F1_9EUKA|nr:Cell motility MEMO family protein [Hexamita inflata]